MEERDRSGKEGSAGIGGGLGWGVLGYGRTCLLEVRKRWRVVSRVEQSA